MIPQIRAGEAISLTSSAAMLLLMGGVPQIVVAADAYEGTAVLCAVDRTDMTVDQKGNSGAISTSNQLMLFRIDIEGTRVSGWEVLTANTKSSPSGGGYNWGEALLRPDEYPGSTLVDNFKFPLKQAATVTGTYEGTGALAGVTVDYALTAAGYPNELPTNACFDMPWSGCVQYDPTQLPPGTCEWVPPGMAGYYMTIWVDEL